jgi:capsular polysaccharide biosynthesis protein
VAVTAALAYAVAALSTPSYSATAKVLLDQDRQVDALLGTDGYSPDPERELNTAVLLITQQPIAERVRRSLGAGEPAGALAARVSAAADSSSSIIAITATDPDPARAARIANGFASAYRGYRSETTAGAVGEALASARAQRSSLPDDGAQRELDAEIRRLQALAAFSSSGVQLVQRASPDDVARRPRPALAGFVGGFLGLVIAAVAIVVLTRTDRRVREERDVELATGRPVVSPTALALSLRGPVVLLLGEGASAAARGVARSLAAGDRSGIVIEAGDDPAPPSLRVETARAEAELVLLAGEGLELAALADEVVLVARLGTTRRDRLARAVRELGVVGMPPVAVVAVSTVPAHREMPVARPQEVVVG